MEIWKPVKDYEEFYEVSNLGRIRSKTRYVDYKPHGISKPTLKYGQIIKPYYNKGTGYKSIGLNKYGKSVTYTVHQLVAEVFCKKVEGCECINHKNGRKLDNRANNLEWVTYKENNEHAYKLNLKQCKHKKSIYCIELNKTFDCAHSAAIFIVNNSSITSKLSTVRGNVRECAKGKLKSAYKYHWRYI